MGFHRLCETFWSCRSLTSGLMILSGWRLAALTLSPSSKAFLDTSSFIFTLLSGFPAPHCPYPSSWLLHLLFCEKWEREWKGRQNGCDIFLHNQYCLCFDLQLWCLLLLLLMLRRSSSLDFVKCEMSKQQNWTPYCSLGPPGREKTIKQKQTWKEKKD